MVCNIVIGGLVYENGFTSESKSKPAFSVGVVIELILMCLKAYDTGINILVLASDAIFKTTIKEIGNINDKRRAA